MKRIIFLLRVLALTVVLLAMSVVPASGINTAGTNTAGTNTGEFCNYGYHSAAAEAGHHPGSP